MIRKNIPNFLTIFNIILGLTSIILAYNNLCFLSCISIYVAIFFDFFDGFLAKKLNVTSEFGKNLDSLSDLISFGLAPAFLLFIHFQNLDLHYLIYYSPFIISIVSVIRLAKFNTLAQNMNFFRGLPTPLNALFWGGWVNASLIHGLTLVNKTTYQIIFIVVLLIFSFLMLSKLKFFKLKFNLKLNNHSRNSYLFCVLSIILIFFLKHTSLIGITFLYIFFSIFLKIPID